MFLLGTQVLVAACHDFCFRLNAWACEVAILRDGEECSDGPGVRFKVKLEAIDSITQAETLVLADFRFIKVLRAGRDFECVSVPLENSHLRRQALVRD